MRTGSTDYVIPSTAIEGKPSLADMTRVKGSNRRSAFVLKVQYDKNHTI
jgi:hypothetical protein